MLRVAPLALLFLVAHLVVLPSTLDDIDAINFALGVRDFDVARHQPHPPGYPIFIALGKIATPILAAAGVPAPAVRGLAVWSALAGALALWPILVVLGALDGDERRARWATAVAAACPLFWSTALRPLSDMTGLAAALAAQAMLVTVAAGRHDRRLLFGAAALAGLAIGIRSQTLLLTLPLFAVVLLMPGLGLDLRDRVLAVGAAAGGALLWAVPLVAASGGPAGYLAALGSQAGEDFSGVVMLWTTRTARAALDAVLSSFLWPWGSPIVGGLVTAVGAVGLLRLAWIRARSAALLLVAYVPYAVFHLLFQETATVRYALPLMVPVAYLVVVALDAAGRVGLVAGAGGLIAASLVVAVPAAVSYGRLASPPVAAFEALSRSQDRLDVVAVHAINRRAAEWQSPALPGRLLTAPHGAEWLALVAEWRARPDADIAFVADPARTDLQLFDRTGRRPEGAFQWPFAEPPYVGGARPLTVRTHRLSPPGWMLDRGWALTAEIAGITARDGWGPHRRPSVAWIRTRPLESQLVIGGRHLGSAADPAVRIELRLGAETLAAFDAHAGFFDRVVTVPAGALVGKDGYLPLSVSSRAAHGEARELPVALEQFDLQGPGVPMLALQGGWYEPEYDRRTARAWRWIGDRATSWVRPIGRDVVLTLAGESPLRYYDGAPVVTVSVGDQEVASLTLSADFSERVSLPAALLAAANGRVTITCSRSFAPGAQGSADPRRLALRIYDVAVE